MPTPTMLDFDEIAPGSRVGTQYRDQGVTFTLRGSTTPGLPAVAAGPGTALTLGSDGPEFHIHDLQVEFAQGASFASLLVLDANEAFRLRAYYGATELAIAVLREAVDPPGSLPGPAFRISIGSPDVEARFTRIVLDVTNFQGWAAGGPEYVDEFAFVAAPIATDLVMRFGQAAGARSWILPGTDPGLLPSLGWAPPHDAALLPIERRPSWDADSLMGGLVRADTEVGAHHFATPHWGAVRNAQALASSSESLRFEGFVHVDVVVGTAEAWGSRVELIAAKRGNVLTGPGDDHVVVAAASNGPAWGQSFRIEVGDGDDRVELRTLDELGLTGAGFGHLRQGNGKALDGSGAGQTAWVRGGDGRDVFLLGGLEDRIWGGAGADVFRVMSANARSVPDVLYDFDAREDVLDLSALDADLTRPGDQAFAMNGTGAGALWARRTSWGTTELVADRTGDGAIDWTISLGVYGVAPVGSHLIL